MEGYAKLAALMGNDHTDGHFLIFQKFEALSAQNLLYLQAELMNQQEGVTELAKEDAESDDPNRRLFSGDWWALSSEENSQWQKWLEIRSTLKEYYAAIAQHAMILNLPRPKKHDLHFLQQWLQRPSMGDHSFVGADCHIYDTENATGLATLAPKTGEVDTITEMLVSALPNLYHRAVVNPLHHICGFWIKKPEAGLSSQAGTAAENTERISEIQRFGQPGTAPDTTVELQDLGSPALSSVNPTTNYSGETSAPFDGKEAFDEESHIFLYRDSYIHRFANALATVISSLIPIAAIVVLYFVSDMGVRLGIVCAFTALFSISLALVTEARRVEIFAATAAFASVQVVFVGSTKWS